MARSSLVVTAVVLSVVLTLVGGAFLRPSAAAPGKGGAVGSLAEAPPDAARPPGALSLRNAAIEFTAGTYIKSISGEVTVSMLGDGLLVVTETSGVTTVIPVPMLRSMTGRRAP